jgi:hypothetical protein
MRRLRFPLVVLAPILLGWSPTVQLTGGPGLTEGGAKVLFTQDFESNDTCVNLGAELATGTPDCQYSAETLAGNYSMMLAGFTDDESKGIGWPKELFSEDCDNDNLCRVKALVQVDSAPGSGSNTLLGLVDSVADRDVFEFYIHWTNEAARCTSHDTKGVWTDFVYTVGTTYRMCVEFDLATDSGTAYLDLESSPWCTGGVWSSTCTNTVTNEVRVDRIRHHVVATKGDVIYDNLVVEED